MNEFVGDLGKAAQRVASNVRTEVSVAAKEQKVRDAFQTLGRLYYKAVQAGEEPGGQEFDDQVARIRVLVRQIQEQRQNQKI